MLFGFEDSLKEYKKEWKAAGVDMGFVKDWQKQYDKVLRQAPQLEMQYNEAKSRLKLVYQTLQTLEKCLIESKSSLGSLGMKKTLDDLSKELKKHQNAFNQEFLIGKEDRDFHSTYASILTLCGKNISMEKDALILQSEVENLLAFTKEALEKNWPDFKALAFFYIDRSDKEILDLPHADKVHCVNRLYEEEFLEPMGQMLSGYLSEARVKEILEVDLCLR